MVRRGLLVPLVGVGVLLLALTERWLAPRVVSGRLATADAVWIWTPPDGQRVTPLAFQAARDFELERPPLEAELLVLADEEYVLYLNGARVGGNRYRAGAALDRYAVAPLLVAGRNRLLVELRSGRRAGGLLLRLRGDGGLEIVSGPGWEVIPRHREIFLDPHNDLVRTEPPRILGSPPTGRWRLPGVGPLLPLHGELLASSRRQLPRQLLADGRWQAPRPLRPSSRSLGRIVTFDFGRIVTGYLGLHFDTRNWPKALLYFGSEPADPEAESPDAYALGPRGRLGWEESVPRRFRYVTVVAPDGVRGAYLLPVDETRAAPLLADGSRGPGVFGIAEPPPLVTPVEHEIRRELEGLPGLRGR